MTQVDLTMPQSSVQNEARDISAIGKKKVSWALIDNAKGRDEDKNDSALSSSLESSIDSSSDESETRNVAAMWKCDDAYEKGADDSMDSSDGVDLESDASSHTCSRSEDSGVIVRKHNTMGDGRLAGFCPEKERDRFSGYECPESSLLQCSCSACHICNSFSNHIRPVRATRSRRRTAKSTYEKVAHIYNAYNNAPAYPCYIPTFQRYFVPVYEVYHNNCAYLDASAFDVTACEEQQSVSLATHPNATNARYGVCHDERRNAGIDAKQIRNCDFAQLCRNYHPYGVCPYNPWKTSLRVSVISRDAADSLRSLKTCYIPEDAIENYASTRPPRRTWRELSIIPSGNITDAVDKSSTLRLLSYNVLSCKHATPDVYPHCPAWALAPEFRQLALLDELTGPAPDLIALQELDTFSAGLLRPRLSRRGYAGLMAPKSRARNMTEGERQLVDGCAFFWNEKKLKPVFEDVIEFNELAVEYNGISSECRAQIINRLATRDNIALVAIFEILDAEGDDNPDRTPRYICVCNTHVFWDPEFSDVKLIQTIMLAKQLRCKIDAFQRRQANSHPDATYVPDDIPVVICGDFNSLPDSGVVNYLLEGRVTEEHSDFRRLNYRGLLQWLSASHSSGAEDGEYGFEQEDDLNDGTTTTTVTHPFTLANAYRDTSAMPYSNYTVDFKGTIDYIFYSRKHLQCQRCLESIPTTWFETNNIKACPNAHAPSDHFSLVIDLQLL